MDGQRVRQAWSSSRKTPVAETVACVCVSVTSMRQ